MNYYSAGFYKVINGSNEGDSTVLHTFTIYCKSLLDILYTHKNLVIIANYLEDVNVIFEKKPKEYEHPKALKQV